MTPLNVPGAGTTITPQVKLNPGFVKRVASALMGSGDYGPQSLHPAPELGSASPPSDGGRYRKLAEALMSEATDASPLQSWWQVGARALKGAVGGLYGDEADRLQREESAWKTREAEALRQRKRAEGMEDFKARTAHRLTLPPAPGRQGSMEHIAERLARNDPDFAVDPAGTVSKWRNYYGLGPIAGAPSAPPSAAMPPQTQQLAPAMPPAAPPAPQPQKVPQSPPFQQQGFNFTGPASRFFNSDPTVPSAPASQAAPDPAARRMPTATATVDEPAMLDRARNAIRNGKDPAAVRQKLIEFGIDPNRL